MTAVGGNPAGGRGSTPCAWCHKRHRSGTYCPVKTRETTPKKTRKTTPKRLVVAWAGVDVDGSFLAGPSNSRREVEKELTRRWPESGLQPTKLVEADPAARELKALEHAAVAFGRAEAGSSQRLFDAISAIEKKRGGK